MSCSFKRAEFYLYIDSVLHNLASKERIENVTINYAGTTLKKPGCIGIINAIELKGSNKTLEVIVKHATLNPNVRARVPIRECFLTEIAFYENVAPVLDEMQEKCKVYTPFTSIGKCYYTNREEYKELIVLENLKVQRFCIWDRLVPVDHTHTELVLKQYARLHGFSLVMKDQQPEKYKALAESMGDGLKSWFKKGELIIAIRKLCDKFKRDIEDETQLKRYTKFCDSIESMLLDYDYTKDEFAAISHVDCLSNNMMFKYQIVYGQKQLSYLKIVDFRLSRCQSIIYDISHFLCTCTDQENWNQLDHFLKIYHNTLYSFVEQLGSDASAIIPFERFKEEFDKKCTFGLAMSSIFIKVMLMDTAEAPNIQDLRDTVFTDCFVKDVSNQDVYNQRFKFLIDYFYKHNYY